MAETPPGLQERGLPQRGQLLPVWREELHLQPRPRRPAATQAPGGGRQQQGAEAGQVWEVQVCRAIPVNFVRAM